ncbi:MAG TPA: alpha/beta fold hydrolase [Candidatus Norongarragalinales archaeon]|jgi:dienelactone hydrolase|nr:alpha/beta fold hydrolase [Candidatus Norongarragalinales archaeon]
MEKVSFETSDGWKIVADLYKPAHSNGRTLIALHMMPALRDSYRELAEELVKKGWTVLSIDSRGHGESVMHNGKAEHFRDFSSTQQQSKIHDIEAARAFLEKTGVSTNRLSLIGASIGANLALIYAANNDVKSVVLLSPGNDYHGVKPESAASKYKGQVLTAASAPDDTYSVDSAKAIASLSKNVLIKALRNAGHGTAMFRAPGFLQEVVSWLDKN